MFKMEFVSCFKNKSSINWVYVNLYLCCRMDEEGKGRGNFFNIALTTNSNLQTRGREGGWGERIQPGRDFILSQSD